VATKLFLRETTNNAIGSYRDMVIGAGSALTTGVVNTVASGTNIQWTKTAGGSVLEWISGKAPVGGFTLSGTISLSIWAKESNNAANSAGRVHLYIRPIATGIEVEIVGSPFDDGVEFTTSDAEYTWTGSPTATVFLEGDRLVCKYYITNAPSLTMGGSRTCTISYDAADAATGDSFCQINENVTFQTEVVALTASAADNDFNNWLDAVKIGRGQIVKDDLNSWNDAAILLQGLLPAALSDDLNLWSDAVAFQYGYLFAVSDDLNLFSDSNTLLYGLLISSNDTLVQSDKLEIGFGLVLSDDLNNWLEEALVQLIGLLSLQNADDLNNWDDSNAQLLGLLLNFSDDLNNWNDSQNLLYAYLIAVGDSFSLTDGTEIIGFLFLAFSDNLNNWSDAALVSLSGEDDMLYDLFILLHVQTDVISLQK